MKKRIPILLLLIVAAAAGWWWWNSRHTNDGNRILVSGNLELTQVDISFKVPGKLVELDVDEGSYVKCEALRG